MRKNTEEALRYLREGAAADTYLIGAAVGSGLTAKFARMAGIDMILALSAGRFRQAGLGSLASYLGYGNSNALVEEFATPEILPMAGEIPVFFGLFASDPTIELSTYIPHLRELGFAGVVNYPTLSLVDGKFRMALEEEGTSYSREVEAIRLARKNGMLTLAFASNPDEARAMVKAGAHILCAHLGLTRGGFIGRGRGISISRGVDIARGIFTACEEHEVIRMIYSGPAATPEAMRYLYAHTACQGYIGGSVFDRIPSENAILQAAIDFKSGGDNITEKVLSRMAGKAMSAADHADVVTSYIAENYALDIRLGDIADLLHISSSRLSTIFSAEMGTTFTRYLIQVRMEIAKRLLGGTTYPIKSIAESVGYPDPAQFSRTFKKTVGETPTAFRFRATSTAHA